MKKQKLSLEELQVNSFVTAIDERQKLTVEGGESAFLCLSISVLVSYSIKKVTDYIKETNDGLDQAQSKPAYKCMGTRDPNATPCPATPYQTKYAQYGCPQAQGVIVVGA